jgi:hypothetical protein
LIGALAVCGASSVAGGTAPVSLPRLIVRPNPVQLGAEFVVDGAGQPLVMLEIYDPAGRLTDMLQPGTRESVSWSPGKSARSGVYFARLRGRGVSQVVKFLVLK